MAAAGWRWNILALLAFLQAAPSSAENPCTSNQECAQKGTSWTSLWYVWLILVAVFVLLMFGIGASCVRICCRKKKPPVQLFPPHDLTVVPMDQDSAAHSTVTSYSSVQYPPGFPLPLPFREGDGMTGSPPAYSLYAIEMPPSYEEAVQMAKPSVGTLLVGQNAERDESAAQPAAPEASSPSSSGGSPGVVPENIAESSTPGQLRPE